MRRFEGTRVIEGYRVAAVILNWNGWRDVIECITSLTSARRIPDLIIVSDNGSAGPDVREIRTRFPQVDVVENGSNLGLAEGQNRGILRALDSLPDYILILNADTVVESDALRCMLETLSSDPSCGVLGPRILHYDDPSILGSSGGTVNLWTGVARQVDSGRPLHLSQADKVRLDFISGTAMLVRREVFDRVGLLEPAFFFGGGEDIDLCLRAKEAGFAIRHEPAARIRHKGETRSRQRWGSLYVYYLVRNRFLVVERHGGTWRLLLAMAYFLLSSPFKIAQLHGQYEGFYSIPHAVRGLVDFLLGRVPAKPQKPASSRQRAPTE